MFRKILLFLMTCLCLASISEARLKPPSLLQDNNLNQLLNSTNPSQAFTYDDDGNMIQGYTPEGYQFTATFDAENRLTSAQYTDSGSVVHRAEYFYSGEGMLAQLKKFENSILVNDTRFVKAGFLPIQERDESNSLTREYKWGLNFGGGIGGLLNLKQAGNDYSYLYDSKGNVSALIDSSQNPVASYRYDVFGKLLKRTGTLSQPFMFSTKQYDEQMGIYDYGWRFYNPAIGRWVTRDPIGERGDMNLYRALGNNPVNYIDPWGLDVLNPNNYPISPAVQQTLENFNNYIGQSKDIVIKGGNRLPSSNLGVGAGSTHVRDIAADIVIPGQSHLQTANQAAESGFFGGVYEEGYRGPHGEGPHVHVDLRNGKARWGYDKEGNRYRGYFPPYNACK